MVFSKDDQYIVFGGKDGVIRILRVNDTYKRALEIGRERKSISGLAIGHDNKYIVYSSREFINIIDFDGKKLRETITHRGVVSYVSCEPERGRIAIADNQGFIIYHENELDLNLFTKEDAEEQEEYLVKPFILAIEKGEIEVHKVQKMFYHANTLQGFKLPYT